MLTPLKTLCLFSAFGFLQLLSAAPQDLVSTEIAIIGLHTDPTMQNVILNGNLEKPVRISGSSVPPTVPYQGPATLTIHDENSFDESAPPLCTVTLKANAPETIILIVGNSGTGTDKKYRAAAIPVSKSKFPPGSRLLYNFTKYDIRGKMAKLPYVPGSKDNHTFRVASGQPALVPSPNGKPLEPFGVLIESNKDGQWKKFSETRWFHNEKQRSFIFILPKAKGDGLTMRAFKDTL